MQTPVTIAPEIGRIAYLDPTGFVQQTNRMLTPRLGSVTGKVAGLLDNGNDTSSFFFASLAGVLQNEFDVSQVVLRTKFTSTRPAEADVISRMAEETDFLISGVAL